MGRSRDTIRFIRGGQVVELTDVPPTRTLLDYLRLEERACGTKEGCNEGDCGACTVVFARLRAGKLVHLPVNSCITFLGQADGAEILTVEDLADGEQLHPVQQAMVDRHGSQCGFCTPGIVMSLFAGMHGTEPLDRAGVLDALAGNLCRCTGYRPIVDAALEAVPAAVNDRFANAAENRASLLAGLEDEEDVFAGSESSFFAAPASIDSLASLYAEHPDAVLVGGATDVGLWVTKQLRHLPKIVWTGRVAGFAEIQNAAEAVSIGAGATYAQAAPALAALDPDMAELLRRLGSRQVRACGTIGGNIANGSPIGDTPPALIALGAKLELRQSTETRSLALEDFFITYGKQDRRKGEFVSRIVVPRLQPEEHFRAYKVAKRYDQDITAVLGAFMIGVDDGRINLARLAFGGMAGTPKRARLAEQALLGLSLDEPPAWSAAVAALGDDFAPLSDMRASAAYRTAVAGNLLRKALHEIAGRETSQTRVFGYREGQHAADAA